MSARLGLAIIAVLGIIAILGPAAAAAPQGDAAKTTQPGGAPRIAASSWVLVDPRDGAVLASHAGERPLPIASATKLMTAYLALKKLKPNETLQAVPYRALAVESVLGLRAGERMTVRDLLYALLLPSANDAAVTLAAGVAGTEPRFVARMNAQAAALGLGNTSYANPIGLDDPDNYSSAEDLVSLATVLLKQPLFARIVDSPAALLRSGDEPRRVSSRNTLLGQDPTVDGVKTGHTIKAGYVLVGSATREGTRLISAVLGAKGEAARDAETEKLFEYGFSLYTPSRPVAAGEELADPKLDYRSDHLPLVAMREIEVSARDGQPVETRVEAPDEVSGPVEEGEALGRVIVTVDGREAAAAPLVAAESVGAATITDKALTSVQKPLVLLAVGVFVIVVGLLVARARRPKEARSAPRRDLRAKLERTPHERTPEERREMHEERMRKRQQRTGDEGGAS